MPRRNNDFVASVPVVVLGFHHGALAIARSLGRLGVRVYGVDSNLGVPGLSSRYCRGAFQWDFRRSDPAASVRFLQDVARKVGAPAILIPTSDDLTLFVAEHAAELEGSFRFTRLDPALVRSLSDKAELYHLARRLSIPTPETAFPRLRADVVLFADGARFPVMLKGIDGLRLEARTGKKMVIVHSPAELLDWYDRLEDPARPNLMLQEYIPGGDDTIWMFDGYFDERSECVAGFTGKKLRQHPVHTGATSLGICLANPTVHELTTRFMKAIGYRGILDIGYRYDARDGLYKLLDPNPRIGSTFRLFVGDNGMDVVRYLYRDLTGQPLPPSALREGRRWLIEDKDLESTVDYLREGTLSLREWARSFAGVEETAWFARDDLRPFWKVAREVFAKGARYIGKRIAARLAPASAPIETTASV